MLIQAKGNIMSWFVSLLSLIYAGVVLVDWSEYSDVTDYKIILLLLLLWEFIRYFSARSVFSNKNLPEKKEEGLS